MSNSWYLTMAIDSNTTVAAGQTVKMTLSPTRQ
jgi:hypothetical protein